MKIAILSAAVAALFAFPVLASPQCYVDYEQFEEVVPHFDIYNCPKARFTRDEGFCRLQINGDKVSIYHFKFGDQNCLIGVDTYNYNDFVKKYGPSYDDEAPYPTK